MSVIAWILAVIWWIMIVAATVISLFLVWIGCKLLYDWIWYLMNNEDDGITYYKNK